jgi:hypothetical protein
MIAKTAQMQQRIVTEIQRLGRPTAFLHRREGYPFLH